MRFKLRAAGVICAALAAACAPAQQQSGGGLMAKAGDAGTLLVGNKGEDTVSFIDLASGGELARVKTGRMPHEIAVSPDGERAAVVAYGGASIDIFEVDTFRLLRRIDLSPNQGPHGLVWLPDGRLVATTERSQTLTIVDTRRKDAVSAVRTDQQGTHMVAVSGDLSRAYTANIPAGTVTVIDLKAGRKLRDIAVGGRPEGIAVTPDGRTLWVGDLEGARVQAYDTKSFERVAEVKTGPVPIRVLASADGRWIVTSNLGSGSLSIIDAKTRKLAREVPVSGSEEAGQVTILFSRDGKRIYAAETGRDEVAEVDLGSGRVLRRIKAGKNGDGLAIAPPD
jgi:YVTN family beta-propeller protein